MSRTLCAVMWCAAFATKGEYCPVHAIDPKLHPENLAADEVFAPDLAPCKDCGETGECEACDGDGECGRHRECDDCGASMAHECGVCEGSGKCKPCDGSGRVCFTKKDAAQA